MSFDLNAVPSQEGRVAIVTGANTGLGYETTLAFAKKGIRTVMACRSEERGQAAKARIEAEVPGAALEMMQLDLSALASVRDFAERFRASHDKLDLLVLNAGIMMSPYERTVDGFEGQMAANYFGHFLLTSLLIDLMPDDAASRVVALSSNAHRMADKRIRFEDLHWHEKYSTVGAYAQSKLACLMFGNELSRQLEDSGRKTVALSAHPGISDTELARHMPGFALAIAGLVGPLISHKPPKGALPQIQAALDENAKGGEYYGPTGFREMKGPPGKVDQLSYAKDPKLLAQLWDVSKEATGAQFPWDEQVPERGAHKPDLGRAQAGSAA